MPPMPFKLDVRMAIKGGTDPVSCVWCECDRKSVQMDPVPALPGKNTAQSVCYFDVKGGIMRAKDLRIVYEIEPIVKLNCFDEDGTLITQFNTGIDNGNQDDQIRRYKANQYTRLL